MPPFSICPHVVIAISLLYGVGRASQLQSGVTEASTVELIRTETAVSSLSPTPFVVASHDLASIYLECAAPDPLQSTGWSMELEWSSPRPPGQPRLITGGGLSVKASCGDTGQSWQTTRCVFPLNSLYHLMQYDKTLIDTDALRFAVSLTTSDDLSTVTLAQLVHADGSTLPCTLYQNDQRINSRHLAVSVSPTVSVSTSYSQSCTVSNTVTLSSTLSSSYSPSVSSTHTLSMTASSTVTVTVTASSVTPLQGFRLTTANIIGVSVGLSVFALCALSGVVWAMWTVRRTKYAKALKAAQLPPVSSQDSNDGNVPLSFIRTRSTRGLMDKLHIRPQPPLGHTAFDAFSPLAALVGEEVKERRGRRGRRLKLKLKFDSGKAKEEHGLKLYRARREEKTGQDGSPRVVVRVPPRVGQQAKRIRSAKALALAAVGQSNGNGNRRRMRVKVRRRHVGEDDGSQSME